MTVEINPEDLRIDTFHACEHSGFVHTNHTAVRITHLPTGAYVESKIERSLHKNKQRCVELLPAAIEAKIGARAPNRAEELIADLEAEIAKRDAKIAELERDLSLAHMACELAEEELAALKARQGEAVAWRDHSVNHAKGEKCPATIETLQAAWDRDQELLLDQKNVISKLKETINQLRQKRTTRPTATIQGEANRRPQTCNGRRCSWCKEGADPCHYTAPPASADAVSVPAAMPERWEDRLSRMHQTIQAGCWPKRWVDDAKDYELGELRALLAQ